MKDKILSDVSRFRREEASKSILVFAETYFKHHLQHMPSEAHRRIYGLLLGLSNDRGKKMAIAAPRGFGKTTLVALIFITFSVCYKREAFIEVIANTFSQAAQMLENIKIEFLDNEKLIMDFPDLLNATGRFRLRLQKDSITIGKTKILALGAGQKPRGRKFGIDRPTLIIIDDFENPENTLTAESREKIKNIFEKTILPSGSERTNFIFLGNLFHPYCLLSEYISKDKNQSWIKEVYSAIVTLPNHFHDLWSEWSEIYNNKKKFEGFDGPAGARLYYERFKVAMDEGTRLLWPERYNLYDLMVMREENEYAFLSEMQNQPLNPKECIFDIDTFHYYNGNYKSVDEFLKSLGEGVQIFAACDPSTGEGKDRSAIVILATSSRKPKTYYIIEADIKIRPVSELVDDILAYHARYGFTDFEIETNGFQHVMVKLLEDKAAEQGLRIPIAPFTNADNKKQKLYLLHPLIKNGTIQFNKNHKALLEESRYFPKGHDDGLDALEMAYRLVEQYTNTGFENYEKEREKEKQAEMDKPDSQRKVTGIIGSNDTEYRPDDIDWLTGDYKP